MLHSDRAKHRKLRSILGEYAEGIVDINIIYEDYKSLFCYGREMNVQPVSNSRTDTLLTQLVWVPDTASFNSPEAKLDYLPTAGIHYKA